VGLEVLSHQKRQFTTMAFRFFLLLAIVVAVTAYAPSAGKVGLNQPNSMLNHPASNKATLLRQPERESRTAISAAAGGALISPITRASLNAVSKLMSTCGIGVLASKKVRRVKLHCSNCVSHQVMQILSQWHYISISC
jgi:hypothetical protein